MAETATKAISRVHRRIRAWLRYRKKRAALPGTSYEIIGELAIPHWKHRHMRSMIGERQLEWLNTDDPRVRRKIARQIHVDVLSRCVLWVVFEGTKHVIIGFIIQRGGK